MRFVGRRAIGVTSMLGILLVLGLPAGADPGDGNGTKTVSVEDYGFAADCGDGVFIEAVADGWVQMRADGSQVGHIAYTYTEGDRSFTYVESYVDRNYENQDGEHVSTRRGRMFDGLIGFSATNDVTGEEVSHGEADQSADEQACAALVG